MMTRRMPPDGRGKARGAFPGPLATGDSDAALASLWDRLDALGILPDGAPDLSSLTR